MISTTVSQGADGFEVPRANLMLSIVTLRESSTSAPNGVVVQVNRVDFFTDLLHSGF
jgi:hypothetical protein